MVGNVLAVKAYNQNLVRRALCSIRQGTKQQLADMTGLSSVTVGTILNEMAETGEAREAALVPSGGGRPSQVYAYCADFLQVLIVYGYVCQGRDTLFFRVVNAFGECVAGEQVVPGEITMTCFEPYIEKFCVEYPGIHALGFGLPGVIQKGKIASNDYAGLVNTDFCSYYEKKFQLPVLLENDVNLAAIGYDYLHPDPERRAVVYLYFPGKYNPGAGILIHGALYRGKNSMAGEMAYLSQEIGWSSMDYGNTKQVGEGLIRLLRQLSGILDPDLVVLNGEFFSEEQLDFVKAAYSEQLLEPERIALPACVLAEDFQRDYETGLMQQTLKLVQKMERQFL